MRWIYFNSVLLLSLGGFAQSKIAKNPPPVITVGTVMVYSITDGGTLTIKITKLSPLSIDYVITGSNEYVRGSLSHDLAYQKTGKSMRSPFHYKDAQYAQKDFLSLWVSGSMSAAFKAKRKAELEYEGELISFTEVSETDFNFNLHENLYNRDTKYTTEFAYVHGKKREFKAYSATNAEGDASIHMEKPCPALIALSLYPRRN